MRKALSHYSSEVDMKGFITWLILAITVTVCIQGVSAMSLTSITIDPTGSLTPASPVTVSFKIDATNFPSTDDLQFYTELDKPRWTYTIIVGGIEQVRPTNGDRTFSLPGFEISYQKPPVPEVSLAVTLQGTAPSVTQTSDKTILRVQEMDANGRAIASTKIERTAKVVNIAEVKEAIAAGDLVLQAFRTHIDEKYVMDIDTSAAEVKYNEAKQKIDAARALPSNQYTTALNNLNLATTAMKDGEKLLEKAWAESEVTAAQEPINKVDDVIAWFKGNTTTANDQQLPAIVAKREVAVSYISTANDQIASGDYAQARNKAKEAFTKGNESYNDALARKKQLMSGIDIPGIISGFFKSSILVIIVGVVLVVLVAVGIIIYRKRSRWDELG